MRMEKICFITGTRAEYGLLAPLMKKIEQDQDMNLQIIASGMHLSPEFGMTYRHIEQDGFKIDEKVEMLLSSDTSIGVGKSIGLGVIGFTDALSRLKPDLIVVLGDRFETFAASQAATVLSIPVAHIHGGEVTYGAYDDQFRHAITKLSYLHFTSTELYRKRVIRLGESPTRVYNVGAAGIDNILNLNLLNREELETELNIQLLKPLFLITQHPTTLSKNPIEGTFEMLEALRNYPNATIIFTKSNADHAGREINRAIERFVDERPEKRTVFESLGSLRYLSLLKQADVVIGNSSSGILESPYLRTPTVNIGDRQRGRVAAESVFDCSADSASSINLAIEKAMSYKFDPEKNYNLYGHGNVADKMYNIIKNFEINSTMKEFYDGEIL